MHIVQTVARTPAGVAAAIASLQAVQPNLILVFGAAEYFDQTDLGTRLAAAFPEAASLGCSTAGEITAKGVDDGSCSFTGLRLERTRLTRGRTELRGMEDSFAAGQRLVRPRRPLMHWLDDPLDLPADARTRFERDGHLTLRGLLPPAELAVVGRESWLGR